MLTPACGWRDHLVFMTPPTLYSRQGCTVVMHQLVLLNAFLMFPDYPNIKFTSSDEAKARTNFYVLFRIVYYVRIIFLLDSDEAKSKSAITTDSNCSEVTVLTQYMMENSHGICLLTVFLRLY